MGVEQTWSTWIFLGALAAVTAGLLWAWSRGLRSWKRLLPEVHPDGWTRSTVYGQVRHQVGAQFGSTFESDSDPGALWRLYWELPDKLVAVRRPKFPRPMGALVTTVTTDGVEVDYDDTRVLLAWIDAAMVAKAAAHAERLQGREGGAEEFIELLVAAGATPVVVATTES